MLQVQKSASHYTDAAKDEIELLEAIRDNDGEATGCCVRMVDSFPHRGPHGLHMCMIFEALGENLLAVIKRYNYRGLPLPLVRRLTVDMLRGLDYLHR